MCHQEDASPAWIGHMEDLASCTLYSNQKCITTYTVDTVIYGLFIAKSFYIIRHHNQATREQSISVKVSKLDPISMWPSKKEKDAFYPAGLILEDQKNQAFMSSKQCYLVST